MIKSARNRILSLVVVVAGSAACGALPTAPEAVAPVCLVQSLACFHFKGSLAVVSGQAVEIEGWSQDMPLPGYANRWRYVLSSPSESMLARFLAPTRGWVGGAAVVWPGGQGGMYMEALEVPGGPLLWRLDMRPTDPGVAAQFAALAGAVEYRAQRFEARPLGDGQAEILITEPN